MIRNLALSLLVPVSVWLVAREPSGSATSEEPPLQLVIEIGDQKVDAVVGKPMQVKVGGETVSLRVTTKPTRHFSSDGISFSYPSNFTFSIDPDTPAVKIWSIEGSDTMIMLQRHTLMPAEMIRDMVAEATLSQLGGSPKKSSTTLNLGNEKHAATTLELKIAGQTLTQHFVGLKGKTHSFVLLIQDSADGENKELAHTLEILKKTFKIARDG